MSEKTTYLNKEQILNEYLAENEADKKKKLTVNIYEHSYSITCGKKILKSVQAIEGSFKDITEAHIYGYARVSTKGQAKDGNSLEAQEKALRENGAEVIYSDAFTGTKADRPEFTKLLDTLKSGDTLIVTKLDRFARSASDGIRVIDELTEQGVKVNVLNIGIIDNTPTGKLIRTVFLAFAEFERDMIVTRTQEGKAIAKQNPNYKEGRPKKYTTKQLDHALELKESMSYSQVEEVTGIPKRTLIRYIKEKKKENND